MFVVLECRDGGGGKKVFMILIIVWILGIFIDCRLFSFFIKLVTFMLFNRDVVGEEIKELLVDFRNKRVFGFGSLFGDY